jgi:hypothetical protein
MAILTETASLMEMTALEETMLEEVTSKHAVIAESPAITNPIEFTTNERRKHEPGFAKAQFKLQPLEIEISFQYPVISHHLRHVNLGH